MTDQTYREIEMQYELPLYGKREVNITRGEGAILFDVNGRSYLDCVCGHGVANLGHCHPRVVSAIQRQAATLVTCPGIMPNEARASYLQKLNQVTPDKLNRFFLCNSGAEAVEASIKLSRLSTGRSGIVAAMRGFHGRTYGALSATFNPKYRQGFEPLVPNYKHVPFNNTEKLESAIDQSTAAVLLEVIQGEGGVHPAEQEFLTRAHELCESQGALLILDEIQTGFGRTGRMFAFEHYGIVPDLVCAAKAIAGGVPMGALLCSDKVQVQPGKHGTTFGGNPLACAAALATLEVLEEDDMLTNAKMQGEQLLEKLSQIESDKIREVRGIGLMIGVELKEKSAPYIQAMLDKGVLALPAGPTVIRVLPPLNINDKQVDIIAKCIAEVL